MNYATRVSKLAALLLVLGLVGCFESGAAEKLEKLGYTNVHDVQSVFFADGSWKCGKGTRFEFKATNPFGAKVKGVVCYPNFVDVVSETPL